MYDYTEKKLFLYGSGIEGKKWIERIDYESVYGFIDSDNSKSGQYVYGKRIYSLHEVSTIGENAYIFISANERNKIAIINNLEKSNLLQNVVGVPYIYNEVKAKIDSKIDSLTVFEGKNSIDSMTEIYNCSLGYGTYVASRTKLLDTYIGRYSCIGPNVSIVVGQHPTNKFVSISPYFYSNTNSIVESYVNEQLFEEYRFTKNGYRVEIGNDVWIGANVSIMEGVTVADGTIIASGANVVKDTEPYSVIGGNPAQIIKYRFNKEQIDFLLAFKWWNKPIEWIEKNADKFKDIELFANAMISTK